MTKSKDKEHKVEEKSGYGSDDEEAHFLRKIERGIGKYKGKLPLKWFNCGRVGHYAKKCPFEEKKIFHKKKGLCSKEENISLDERDGEEMDTREVIFITQETQDNDHKEYKIDEDNFEEYSDEETEGTILESFWGAKDITKSEQEDDENLEKLNYAKEENSKLRNVNR